MGPDLVPLTACPACGSALRPGAPWCTLCYIDLRSAPELDPAPTTEAYAEPAPEPLLVAQPQAGADRPPDADPQAGPTWPCSRCGDRNALALDACSACGASFLAAVRDDKIALIVPGIGDLMTMSRGKRLGLAFGAVVVLVVPLALVTLLLTGSPPATTPPAPPRPTVTATP